MQSLAQVCEFGVDLGLVGDDLLLLCLHLFNEGKKLLLLLLWVGRLRGAGQERERRHGKENGERDSLHKKKSARRIEEQVVFRSGIFAMQKGTD